MNYRPEAVAAAECFLRRKEGEDVPGHFDKGWFVPDEQCDQFCPRVPSHPLAHVVHGRSLIHICGVLGADYREAKAVLRETSPRPPRQRRGTVPEASETDPNDGLMVLDKLPLFRLDPALLQPSGITYASDNHRRIWDARRDELGIDPNEPL